LKVSWTSFFSGTSRKILGGRGKKETKTKHLGTKIGRRNYLLDSGPEKPGKSGSLNLGGSNAGRGNGQRDQKTSLKSEKQHVTRFENRGEHENVVHEERAESRTVPKTPTK